MKKLIFFFLLISPAVFVQEGFSFSDIYIQNYKGVVLIEEGVIVRPSNLEHADLFKRIEKLISKKLLDEYYCYAKGSGFIVSQENHIITNHHVLSYISIEKRREWLFHKFIYDLALNLPPGYLTKKELLDVTSDFQKMLEDVEFNLIVRFYDESYSFPTVLVSDADVDISLLKADVPDGVSVLEFSASALRSGQTIAALGFPLQNLIKNFLKEFKATFSTGVVSAVRNEEWGIQHTASINPGNSGGPLLDKNGKVVGVNVGEVRKANNLYFAIPIDRCIKWLGKKGYNF